jgi:hypothetical protein
LSKISGIDVQVGLLENQRKKGMGKEGRMEKEGTGQIARS